jgi:membrane protein YdbS with pleckstrin-like domain
MAFPTKELNPGEQVVLDTHPHWWYLARPVAAAVVVLAGGIAALVLSAPTAVDYVVLVVLLVVLGWLSVRYLRWLTTSLVVTTTRLVHRSGILAKKGREIPLDHLADISYRQTFFERILRAGDIVLESAGRDSEEVFPALPRPAQIQNEIYRQIEQYNGRRFGAPAPAAPTPSRELSIPEQIAQLDDLRRRGVLTEEEFAAKKAELLQRM